jgi:alpha-tubulin suppressor-like RCC1 family protein
MQRLSAGEEHTAVVRSDGALFTCGSNSCGQLGHGDGENTDVLTRVQGALVGKRVVAVAAGDFHTEAVTDTGELFTWGGRGRLSRLGHGDEEEVWGLRLVPTQVQGELSGKRVIAVTAGSWHAAAVTESGELYVWGDRVACGSATDVNAPRLVGSAMNGAQVVAVSAGQAHTAVLTAAGAVYTFGEGYRGQLGHGDRNRRTFPTLVGGALHGRVAVCVSAGGYSTAVVLQSGELYTFGQTFAGEEEGSTTPTLVVAPQGTRFVSVSVGLGNHMVAIAGDGTCYTWGRGVFGELGHDDEEDCILPKQVVALAGKRVSAVATGGQHSAAITAEGDLFTWGGGSTYFPQLGLGTADDRAVYSPTAVPRVGGIPWCTPAPAAAGLPEEANAAANAGNAGAAATTHAGTAEPLPDGYAALTTLMRGIRDTDVSALDDAALTAFDRRIARVHACVRSTSDELAAKRTVVKSELTRRRCAEEVAKAQPDVVCPISHALMHDPVLAADGHSYERREIELWFAGGNVKSPLTGADLVNTTLYPNITLKKMIERAMEAEMAAGSSGSGAEEEDANADRRQRRRNE